MINDVFHQRLILERRRLDMNAVGQTPGGIGTVRFIVSGCDGSETVLENAKAVLRSVNEASGESWPTMDEWRTLLPSWFVKACSRELTPDEAELQLEAWHRLTPAEQVVWERESPWSLANWLSWFEPTEREWYWWDGAVLNTDTAIVAIEVEAWPFAWGSLAWLFRASGAVDVQPEE